MKTYLNVIPTRFFLLSFVLAPLFAQATTTNYFNFIDTSLATLTGPSTPANGVTSISGTGLAVGDKIVFDGVVINLPGTTADAWGAINLNNTAAGTRGVTASQIGVLARSTTGGANGCQIFINSGGGVNFGPSTGARTNRVRIEMTATIANSTTNMNYTVQVDQGLTGTFNASTSGALTFNGNAIALTFGSQNFSHSFQSSLVSGSIFTPNSTVGVGDSAVFSVVITNGYPVLGTSQQWLSNGVPIAGATGLTYTTPAVTAGFSGSQYSVVVTNLLNPGTVFTSPVVTLTVRNANTLTWRGVGTVNTNNWDYTATNWVTGGVRTNFVDGDTVTFDDTGTNVFVGLTNVVQPAGLMFNSASNYALFGSGGISGSTSLTKSGSGTLTLGVTNGYTGTTSISGGTLKLASAAGTAAAPVLYMSFDDVSGTNVINEGSGGSALNGVLTGTGATIVSGGRHGNALQIDGNGAKAATNIVLIAGGRGVNLDASASWTVGYWVKTSTPGSMCLYQGTGTFNSGAETIFYINSASATTTGTKAGGVRFAGGFLTGTTVINDGNWHFIAMVNNLGSETIYVDGNSDVVTSSMGGSSTSAANQLWIGGGTDTDASATKLNGLLDEVFMYSRALSQGEIQRMMNAPGSLPAASAVSVAAGSKLDLSGFSQTVSGLTGAGTVDTASSTNAVVLTVSNASSGTFSGIITNTAGSLAFVKTGAGSLTLSGTSAATGANTVSAGTLNISGSVTAGAGTMTVGNTSGNAVVNFSGLGLTNLNYNVGTASGAVGAIYQTAGTVRATQGGGPANFQLGNSPGAYGYYYIGSGAVLSANEIGVAGESGAGNAVMDINGGTVNDAGWWVISRTGSAQTGILNVFSGTLNYAGGGIVNCWGAGGQTAVVNIMGGTVANTAAVGFNLNQTGNAGNTSMLNLNGGIAQANSVGGAAARINFKGGTLRAGAANASFMTGLGSVNIYGGGATIDNNGFAITIAQPLLSPTGSGVNGITSFTTGAGYVAPPIVTVVRGSGDTTGTGATVIAQIDPVAGTVTNILITSPGVSYTVTPTFTLSGGGATTPATITGQAPTANVSGVFTSLGTGTLTLTGINTFTNNTIIGAGRLALSGSGSLASSGIIVSNGTTLDVSATTGTNVIASGQSLFGSGTVTGAVTTVSGAKIFAGTDGGYATNTFTTNLTFVSGAQCYLDLGTLATGSNDLISVGGTLALNSTVFHIKAPSTSVNLATNADYLLVSAASITGTPGSPVFDVAPLNAANFTVNKSGNNLLLHFTATTFPTGGGAASPASVTRNQSTTISVTVTNGNSGTITNVIIDVTSIGGSATAQLVAAGGNVYTNTFTVSAGSAMAANKNLTVTMTDNAGLTGTTLISLAVTAANQVWNGGAGNDNWSSNPNWSSGFAPGTVGDGVTFAGTTRPTPFMDANYSVTGLIFDSTAGAFTIGTASSTLTLTGGGLTNNSASAETLNVPIILGAAQTFTAAAGNLTLGQSVANSGNGITVAGLFNTTMSGVISGGGGLTKNGNGTLLLGGNDIFSGGMIINGGTLVLSGSNSITGNLVVHNSTTLQLQANSANTIGGLSVAIGTPSNGGGFQFGDGNNGSATVQLRGDSSTTFTNTTTSNQTGNTTLNFDVNNIAAVSGSGPQGNTLTFGGLNTFNTIVNITGGNGYNFAMGSINNALNASLTFNVNSASFIIGGIANIGGTLTFNSTSNTVINGVINGGGGLTKNGGGTLNLNASSTYTGSTTINNSTAYITNTAGIYTGAYNSSAVLTLSNATLVLDRWGYGAGQSLGQLDYNPARFIINGGTVRFTGGAGGAPVGGEAPYGPGFTIGANGATLDAAKAGDTWTVKNDSRGFGPITSAAGGLLTLTGIGNGIFDKALGGAGGVTMNGSATWTLTQPCTYTGATTISGGVLALTNGTSISNTTNIIIGSGATFDVTGLPSAFTLGTSQTLSGSGATGIIAGNVTLSAGSLTLNYTNGTPTLTANNGTVTLNNNAVTVTVLGTALPAGSYKLISTNAGGTVSGSVSSSTVTVNGAGFSAGAATTLKIVNGELYLVINHAPTANSPSYSRGSVNTWKISVTDLLTNAADVDGDTLVLSSLGTSTNGIALTNSGGYVLYVNTNLVNDQFTYIVSDGNGGSATGTVTLVVTLFVSGQNATVTVDGGTAKVGFAGIPGYLYGVQRSTNLVDWVTILTTNAPGNGVFNVTDNFIDLGTIPSSAYYRLVWNGN